MSKWYGVLAAFAVCLTFGGRAHAQSYGPTSCGQLENDYYAMVAYGSHGGLSVQVNFRAAKHACFMAVTFLVDGRKDHYRIIPKKKRGTEVYQARSIGQTRFGKSGCWSTLRNTSYGVGGYLCGAQMKLDPQGE